jgi:hypothetical protein
MDLSKVPADLKALLQKQQVSCVPTFRYTGKQVVPSDPLTVRHTILERRYGLEEVALLQTDPCPQDMDLDRWKAGLEYYLGFGIEHRGKRFVLIGGSSSMKSGRFWLGTQEMRDKAHRYFKSAQEALTYWGILISSNYHGIYDLSLQIALVDDGEYETGDGMGWIAPSLLDKLGLAHRQMQVRLVADNWLAKGTLHPMIHPLVFPEADLVLPKSMIKGAGLPVNGPNQLTLGIRDVAEVRTYNSNFTYAQWFNHDTLEALRPSLESKLQVVESAMTSNQSALEFLHLDANDSEEPVFPAARSKVDTFLQAGLSPRHPWLHRHLTELMRRQYVTLALGGGIELTGYMGAHAELDPGTVCIPDLPEGPVVLSRYPIRDPHSLQAVWNNPRAVPYAISGSIYLTEQTAKQVDGDYDGDYYIVCTQKPVVEAVWSIGWGEGYERVPEQAKKRRSDSLKVLPHVAVEGLGNSIGYITYLITAAELAGRSDLVPKLSASLQDEVQSLKWSTKADKDFISRVEKEVQIPDFLSGCKSDKQLFVKKADPASGGHSLIDNYNRVVNRWRQNKEIPEPLLNFKPEIPLWLDGGSLDCIEEATAVSCLYNRWCSEIIRQKKGEPTMDDLTAPVEFLEAWGQTKDNKRLWAIALWSVVHGTRSDNSGSAVFHAFPEETVQLLQEAHERPHVWSHSERKPISKEDSWTLPVVGGHYFQKDCENTKERFRQQVSNLGQECTITTMQGPDQILFCSGSLVLGSIPKDHLLFGAIPPELTFTAKLLHRGATVWLFTSRLF